MNNRELIAELANRLQWTDEHVSLALQAIVDTISDKLLDSRIVFFPGLGLFCTEKRTETIHIEESTGKRYLYPPAIVVSFFMQNSSDFQLIVAANEVDNLSETLSVKTELSREDVRIFLYELKEIIISANESGCVTIDNLGTFENFSFLPDDSLKESVNKPFAHFEAVLLHDGFDADGIESVQISSEEIKKPVEEKLESNLQKVAEDAAKVIEEDTPKEIQEAKPDCKKTKQQSASAADKDVSATKAVLYFIAGGLLLAASAFLQTKKRDK